MRISIIGGGATGALVAAHLARQVGDDAEIVVVEPAEALGRGVAYSTDDPRHLLNVRVANMSAFADRPDHFHAWLVARGEADCPTPFCFVSRATYGDYVSDLAREALSSGRVRHLRETCVDLVESEAGVAVRLASGRAIRSDYAVLATGHDAKPALNGIPAEQPWAPGSLDGLAPDAPILIIGSGLTMADMALSLDRRGHRGPVTVISRRGLLSHAHRPVTARMLDALDVPFGAELSTLVGWLRRLAEQYVGEGGDWRSAIDALRPHTQRLWRAMTREQRRRFLRHARVYWDIHRHRMAPEIERDLGALRRAGRLKLQPGRIVSARRVDAGIEVAVLPRGAIAPVTEIFARVIDCTGLADDPKKSGNPLIRALLARGYARPDPLGIGLDVAEDFSLARADGVSSPRIKVVGPLARAAFWECIAIPDIRAQARDLTRILARDPAAPLRDSPVAAVA